MGNIKELLTQKKWAVVGANNNKDKFGCRIYKFMKDAGPYTVFPVNPGLEEVQGDKCYASVSDLPEKPDVVDLVVPPSAGEKVLRDCAEAGIKNVWLQPGADAPSLVKLGEELGLNVTCACVMVKAREHGVCK